MDAKICQLLPQDFDDAVIGTISHCCCSWFSFMNFRKSFSVGIFGPTFGIKRNLWNFIDFMNLYLYKMPPLKSVGFLT